MNEQPDMETAAGAEQPPLGDPVLDQIADTVKRRELGGQFSEFRHALKESGVGELLVGKTILYRGAKLRVTDIEGGIIVRLEDIDKGGVLYLPSEVLGSEEMHAPLTPVPPELP